MYLLIHTEEAQLAIETDLIEEVEVQIGDKLVIGQVEAIESHDGGPIRVFWIDRVSPQLVGLLDTHVVRLERTGAQFLFLTTRPLADQLLTAAPNFRNRLTEVMQIVPDDLSGGFPR